MEVTLTVGRRATEEKTNRLRAAGEVPGVLYGQGSEPRSIKAALKELARVYATAGESALLDLTIDGTPVKALFKDIQYEPVTGEITHFDLYRIDMNKKIHTEIPLSFTGVAVAVTELGGTLITSINAFDVECLPQDLVDHIVVDISSLKTFDDVISVKDIAVPAGMKIKNELTQPVAQVVPQQEEVEKGPQSVADIEVVGAKKEEAGEGEAGSAGAPAGAGKADNKKQEEKK